MNKVKLTCRVCGKEYEPCRTAIKNPNVFHWQEVACSPECGAKYLQRVNDSRRNIDATKKSRAKKVVEHNESVVELAAIDVETITPHVEDE